jgi:predicted ABC-type ATPase
VDATRKNQKGKGRSTKKESGSGGRRMTSSKGISPTVYVIAGPNGAGKTTFASEFLPDFVDCREFLNADLIAAGLSPFSPESQNVRAGRLLLERITELAANNQDFGFETTLAGRSYANRFRQMQLQGYQIIVFFLWLPNADLAVSRVMNRVRQGGHNVPEENIRRRYVTGKRNLFRLYRPIVNAWWLYDASKPRPTVIATEENHLLTILQPDPFEMIQRSLEEETHD